MTTVALADQHLSTATEQTFHATTTEVRAALTLLTLLARSAYPDAAYVRLEDSDQGDWMIYGCLLTADGDVIDGSQDLDDHDAASHLYDGRRDVWDAYRREGTRRRDPVTDLDLTVMSAELLAPAAHPTAQSA